MSIRLFEKTPPGIVCPHFWILNWARGCPYNCSYCYLALTNRMQGLKPHFYDWPRMSKSIDKFIGEGYMPSLLNTGELADSLMNPRLMEKICAKFEGQDKHKVLLLTKGCRFHPTKRFNLRIADGSRIRWLIDKHYDQTVFSVSVNAYEFAELYEKDAPNIYDRVYAANTLGNFGYEVRLRIDPIIPIRPPNAEGYSWKTSYRDLVRFMLKTMCVKPDRITLGSPRWYPALPYWLMRAGRGDNFFSNFEKAKELCVDGRYRLKKRAQVYSWMINTLRRYGYKGPISLCKETIDVWQKLRWMLGMRPEESLCNCVL